MNTNLVEIAKRIKGLRELLEYSEEEVAKAAGVSLEDYKEIETGTKDFSFTFLNNVATKLGVDLIELLTGENPRLSRYCLMRKGEGLNMKRREGFEYKHLSYKFKNKQAECFMVTAPFNKKEEELPIKLSTHPGQEFNYILKGSLKFNLDQHEIILNEGDSIYYDSSEKHGMVATNNNDCIFLAITIHPCNKCENN